jgi:hypothetical protein
VTTPSPPSTEKIDPGPPSAAPLPTFRPPKTPPPTPGEMPAAPAAEPVPMTSPSSPEASGVDSGPDGLGGKPKKKTTSSRRSVSDSPAVRKATTRVMELGGQGLNEVFAPIDAPELWLLDDEDKAEMVAPVAAIAGRRVPAVLVGEATADMEDALNAMVAFAVYLSKQLETWLVVRRRRKVARRQTEEAPTLIDEPAPVS